jgi:lipopolysaccharide biosynthesis regulator YciM
MLSTVLVILIVCLGAVVIYLLYERYSGRTRKAESTLYVEALRDLLDNREESAFTKLRQVVADDSGNIDAYLRLGEILRRHHKADRALQVHKDLTMRAGLDRPHKMAILRQLALDYMALEDFATAETALKELILLDGINRWAHKNLLALQERSQNWEAAYDTAAQLLKIDAVKSKKPLAHYRYCAGLDLYRKREYHKARVMLKEAIGLDPDLVDAYLVIGDSYADENRLEDAVNFWNKLIAARPTEGHRAIERLKKTLFELGRFGDIMEICQNILEHDVKNLEARRTLAEFYEKKGELDTAVELLEQIIDDRPDDYRSLLELIRFYFEKGERKKLDGLLRTLERKRDRQESLTSKKQTEPASPGN